MSFLAQVLEFLSRKTDTPVMETNDIFPIGTRVASPEALDTVWVVTRHGMEHGILFAYAKREHSGGKRAVINGIEILVSKRRFVEI